MLQSIALPTELKRLDKTLSGVKNKGCQGSKHPNSADEIASTHRRSSTHKTSTMAAPILSSNTSRILNLAVIGVGLVGTELLRQLSQPQLANKFRLVFVSNSKQSVSSLAPNVHELNFSNWKEVLEGSTAPTALQDLPRILGAFVEQGKEPFAVVDNTSSEAVALLYPKFLRAGVNVVTPNKKAFSSDLWLYDDIVASSAATGAKFLNEATVGAGLPIISTLKDLVETGDEVSTENGWVL